jgi:hypothetical protein
LGAKALEARPEQPEITRAQVDAEFDVVVDVTGNLLILYHCRHLLANNSKSHSSSLNPLPLLPERFTAESTALLTICCKSRAE